MVMKKIAFMALAVSVFAIAACNTIKGAGEDISGAASATQKAMR